MNNFYTFLLPLLRYSVPASKPKKPDTNTAGKDSDSRASTPSKELTPADKSTPNLNTSSTSRSRAPKPASATLATGTGTPNQEQNTSRELKRGGSERDSRDEGPKYVLISDLHRQSRHCFCHIKISSIQCIFTLPHTKCTFPLILYFFFLLRFILNRNQTLFELQAGMATCGCTAKSFAYSQIVAIG